VLTTCKVSFLNSVVDAMNNSLKNAKTAITIKKHPVRKRNWHGVLTNIAGVKQKTFAFTIKSRETFPAIRS
jgi:hypothetical protein